MAHATLRIKDTFGRPLDLRLYWLHGPLAVTRSDSTSPYDITHVSTGLRVGPDCESLAHAVRLARLMRRSFRWETVSYEGWMSLSPEDRSAMGVAIMASHYATSKAAREVR